MDSLTWQQFGPLDRVEGLRHRMVLRHPSIPVDVEREEAISRLKDWHQEHAAALSFKPSTWCLAEQVHGASVAEVGKKELTKGPMRGVDGLICNEPGVLLGIYVADCCAIFLVDPEAGSIGLVHSGKRGSEENIVGAAIQMMIEHHGADPKRMLVQLSPCIRPPAYEVDFAAQIRAGAIHAGVPESQVFDEGQCTSSDLSRFYSYRVEKGRTGRMLALLGWGK